MAAWTLKEAREHLRAWIEADAAVATGQSYKIGSMTLTRVEVPYIAGRIKFWRNEISRLEKGRGEGIRLIRVIPRDL